MKFNQYIEFLPLSKSDPKCVAWWHVVALKDGAYGEAWITADFADQQPLLATLMARGHAAIVLDEFLAEHRNKNPGSRPGLLLESPRERRFHVSGDFAGSPTKA